MVSMNFKNIANFTSLQFSRIWEQIQIKIQNRVKGYGTLCFIYIRYLFKKSL